jgi:hypothetical protein
VNANMRKGEEVCIGIKNMVNYLKRCYHRLKGVFWRIADLRTYEPRKSNKILMGTHNSASALVKIDSMSKR